MIKRIKDKKAFTLIEFIVTIAVLGVLVLLASPRFFGHTQNAELTRGFANAKSIEKASELYYMDNNDWPRLTDEPYTSEEIESYSERIFNHTGHEVNLDPEGNYYDIDYDKLSDYVQVPDDKKNYILQNPVGKVFYMDNLNEAGAARVNYSSAEEDDNPIPIGESIDFAYTGEPESIELGKGTYQLEVWGAQGGTAGRQGKGGNGGYSRGNIQLNSEDMLYVYVGGQNGFNGGGFGYVNGGGASDFRVDAHGLDDRVIIAAGGGGGKQTFTKGGTEFGYVGGVGGGLTGGDGANFGGGGATQTKGGKGDAQTRSNGLYGQGGKGDGSNGSGGGGGYYGGAGGGLLRSDGYHAYGGGGGGSSYIGGIQNGQTISGNQSMPNPNGGDMVGNSGHGFARITRVD